MSDPHILGDITITIKVPETDRYKKDDPWFVFRGTVERIIEDLGITFGISTEGLTLFEATMNAQQVASSFGTTSKILGGTALPANSQGPKTSVFQQAAGASTPAASAAEPAPDVDPILAGIESAQDIDALQKIWQRNQALFTPDSEYMKAYKAKGKSLTA